MVSAGNLSAHEKRVSANMGSTKQPKPLVPYKSLKQKQKARIANWMYRETLHYYLEHGCMPVGDAFETIAQTVFAKAQCYRVTFDEVRELFLHRQEKYELRIQKDVENGMTLESLQKPKKVKKTEAEKLAIKRMQRKNRKKREKARLEQEKYNLDQDDRFYFIAGYTSGGAPYGLTWEEMGLEPWQDIFDEDSDED